eukprot:8079605-Karenia_brevis.AAC.1
MIDLALESDRLTPAQASSMRGKLGAIDLALFGRVLRGSMAALTARQYYQQFTTIDKNLSDALDFIKTIVEGQMPRLISLSLKPIPPVLVYTDASFENGVMRVGAVLYHTKFLVPMAFAHTMSMQDLEVLCRPHRPHITYGETAAVIIAAYTFAPHLRDCSAIWFIDNTSTVSAVIKGSSPRNELSRLALCIQFLFAQLHTKVWAEWVDSESNPSDPFSRTLDDPFVRSAAFHIVPAQLPPWTFLLHSPLSAIHREFALSVGDDLEPAYIQ